MGIVPAPSGSGGGGDRNAVGGGGGLPPQAAILPCPTRSFSRKQGPRGEGISPVAGRPADLRRPRRFAAGSRKTFEKVLSKLSKKSLLKLQTPICRRLHHNRQATNHRCLVPTPRGARGVDRNAVGGVGGG